MATQFEVDCALMAGLAYQSTRDRINWFPSPDGWREFSHVPNPNYLTTNGFEASAFQSAATGEIVIAFAGTGPGLDIGDWLANIGLASGLGSDQLRQAALFYCQIKAASPDAQISFAGHSLGGGLAALLGVFFDRPAITFDQAPFRRSASTGMRDDLLSYLGANGVAGAYLESLRNFTALDVREGNVAGWYVQGEAVTTIPPATQFSGIGVQRILEQGTPDFALAIDLHAQALLSAFLQNDDFREVTFELPDLERMMFDEGLYSFPTSQNKENFIERLVRHEVGISGSFDADEMLDRFTRDLQKVAQDGGLTLASNDLTKALIAFAMQMYYEKTTDKNKTLFSDVTGGIRFDGADVADTLANAKGYALYLTSYLATLPSNERDLLLQQLPNLTDWFIQAGSRAMAAVAGDWRAFMLGGTDGDKLIGSTKADVLLGGAGGDFLNGGAGGDLLIGGTGFDTYIAGAGTTRIVDADRSGRVLLNSGAGILFANTFFLVEGETTEWKSADSKLTLDVTDTWTITFDGGSVDLGSVLNDGDFGIHLTENSSVPQAPQTTRDIDGDQHVEVQSATVAADANGNLQGVPESWEIVGTPAYNTENGQIVSAIVGYFVVDDLRNPVGSGAEPDRPDTLADSERNDNIRSGGGDDVIGAFRGGDDRIDAGAGNDTVFGGEVTDFIDGGDGDDALIGLAGSDTILGGAGDDKLFGDATEGSVTIATPTGGQVVFTFPEFQGADYLDGGEGNDQLTGDGGADELIGGAGNDILIGDESGLAEQWHGADYLDGGDGDDQLFGYGKDDTLYGGAGDDFLEGDSNTIAFDKHGNDYLDGGDGNDTVIGGTSSMVATAMIS